MREGSLQELLNSAVSFHLSRMNTCISCVVVRVYLDEQRVDVQPTIDQLDRDGNSVKCVPILNVPLIYPASSTSAFTFPVNVNDTVLCVFAQSSLDVFKSSTDGLPQPPNDYRRFSQRDAVAIPGFFPFQMAVNNPKKRTNSHSTADAVIVHNIGKANEVEVRLKANGDFSIITPGKAEVICEDAEVNASNSVTVESPDINLIGDITHTGNFASSGGTFTHNGTDVGDTHTHDVPNIQTGGSTRTSLEPNN